MERVDRNMNLAEDIETWRKAKNGLGWHIYEQADNEYVAKYNYINVDMAGKWKIVYTYGMVWMKELSSTDIDYRLECLAIVYAMLKACDYRLILLESWGPKFCCPSGHQLEELMKQIIGDDDLEATEWFTASVVETGRRILTGDDKPKIATHFKSQEDRIMTAVKGTFWRIDEGMFRTALVLHAWLRCGQKISLNDPAIVMGSALAAMKHDALSYLRNSEEKQDKSQVSVLNVDRAAFCQTILFCIKIADIVMCNICDSGVWTVIDNFISAHTSVNVTMKEYGIGETMLVSRNTSLSDSGACNPQINETVVEYYCAVIREASKHSHENGPWRGKVENALDWLDAASQGVALHSNITIEPGRPVQIVAQLLRRCVRFRSPLGIELLEQTNGNGIAYIGLYYSWISFPKHFDYRFVEAVGVLYSKLESGAKIRDAGPRMPELLVSIPEYIVDKAWGVIASLTACNEDRMRLMQYSFSQSFALRSSTVARDFAKVAFKQLKSHSQMIILDNYSKYIEFRLIDGYWRLNAMLILAYDKGRPEDVDSPGLMNFLESGVLLHEEGSRLRRVTDDEGFGYWSCVDKDEIKSHAWGRHRGYMLWRQGWDQILVNDTTSSIFSLGRSIFKHSYSGLPGSATWLAFQQLRHFGNS